MFSILFVVSHKIRIGKCRFDIVQIRFHIFRFDHKNIRRIFAGSMAQRIRLVIGAGVSNGADTMGGDKVGTYEL